MYQENGYSWYITILLCHCIEWLDKAAGSLFLLVLRSHLREEEHILDGRGVGHEHCQTVDSHTES